MSSEQVRLAHHANVRRLKAEIDEMALGLRALDPASPDWKEARRAMGEKQIELRRAYDAYCGGRWLEPQGAEELAKYGIE